MRRVSKRLPDFFRRVAQFSDENERPLLSVLSYLRSAGRTRCVLFAIGHLSSPCLPLRWCFLIHAVEVAFESIDVSGPEPTELSQPGIHLPKWFGLQPVETALCVHRGFHETGVPQHSQVLGDGRLRHPKLTLDLSNRLLGRDQQAQYRAAVRLRNDFEHGFHFLCILHSAYTCQGIFRQAAQATVAEVDFDSLKSALRYFREAAPKHTIEDDVVFSIAGRILSEADKAISRRKC